MRLKNTVSAATILCALLSGCSSDNGDLMQYIRDIKSRPGKAIEPIPKFAPLPTFKFPEHDNRRSPFKPVAQQKRVDLLAPDQKRVKEPLEGYPLDALKFVGLLQQGNEQWALITDPEKKVVPVKVGNYMGQNYGRIIAIKADEIKLEETTKNTGTWEKHITTLHLDTGK